VLDSEFSRRLNKRSAIPAPKEKVTIFPAMSGLRSLRLRSVS
jgi:hypothetical protein